MTPGTLKMVVALLLFSVPFWLCTARLPGRSLGGWRLNRPQAQAVGAALGLVVGVGFLLAAG
jgi:hypothetical protein